MNPSGRLRRLIPAITVALSTVALFAPSAGAAEIPPLAGTAQYKALVGFVEKLDKLSRVPATDSRKASYEDQLEDKHGAATDKAAALFGRGKKAAKVESERSIKTGVKTIRQTEAGELAALRRDYDARMDRAATDHEAAIGRIEDVFDSRDASLGKQIRRLRRGKANAKGPLRKATIQETIDRRVRRAGENRKLQQAEIADLKAGYSHEKAAIRSGKQSATRSLQQDDAEAIVTLRNRGKSIYNTTVRTLQSRRVDQLHDLETKFDAGRAAIRRMPSKN